MGRLNVEIETPTMNSSFDADFYFSAPDSFRANIRGLLGTTPGALVSVGDSTVAYFPSSGTLYVAVSQPGESNPVLGLNIEFSDLTKAITGYFDLENTDSLVNFVDGGDSYELIYDRNGEFIRIEILPSRWVIGSKQIYNDKGTSLLDINYDNFVDRDGLTRASRITIINPVRNERVIVNIEKEYLGRELPDNIFELNVPEDVEIINLL